jgi:hypothetical protein
MDSFQRLIQFLFFALLALSSWRVYAAGGQSVITSHGPAVQYVGDLGNGRVGARIVYGGNAVDLSAYERAIRANPRGAGPGAVSVADRYVINTSRGAITATTTRVATAANIARGAAIAGRILPTAGIAIGVGTLLWDLLDDHRIRPDGAGGLAFDPGLPLTEREGECWYPSIPQSMCYFTPELAGAATAAYRASTGWLQVQGCTVAYVGVTRTSMETAEARWTFECAPGTNYSVSQSSLVDTMNRQIRAQKMCPPPPASTGSPDYDGRCPTGVYDRPISVEDAADKIGDAVGGSPNNVPLVQDIIGFGGGIPSDEGTTSGPSSVTGTPPAPVVSNGPSGQTTTTESPGINLRYRGPEVSWEPQSVTTTRPGPTPGSPDETTTTDAPDDPSADPNAEPTTVNVPDYCIEHPKRAGCSELGEVEPPEWNPDEKPIELRAESPWGSDNASCPPPRTITLGGRQYQWEWTLVCQFFSGIRFAVLTVAWVSAVMIFLGARNES